MALFKRNIVLLLLVSVCILYIQAFLSAGNRKPSQRLRNNSSLLLFPLEDIVISQCNCTQLSISVRRITISILISHDLYVA